jgi:hypothetical protein
MKANPPHLFSMGPSVTLFRDEIDNILTILTTSCESITISDDQYQYDSLEELQEKQGNTIKNISLAGHKPFITLQVKQDMPYVILSGGNHEDSLVPYTKVKELLQRHRRSILTTIFHPISAVSGFILLIAVLVVIDVKAGFRIPKDWVWVLVFAIGLSIAYTAATIRLGAFSFINLSRRHQQKSFWARNKDAIITGIISAIVGGIIALIVARLVT